jgi:putative transposase
VKIEMKRENITFKKQEKKIQNHQTALSDAHLKIVKLESTITVMEREMTRKKTSCHEIIEEMKTRLKKHPDPLIGRCSIQRICDLFGITRQAHYQYMARATDTDTQIEKIKEEIIRIRKRLPESGGRKIYELLPNDAEQMKGIGRDKVFTILCTMGYLLKRKKRFVVYTTMSRHWMKKYSNLIKDLQPQYPGHIIVSDITYMRLKKGFAYLALVTDLYSRKIIGFDLSMSLAAEGCIRALKMALAELPADQLVIHHSDGGVQYCCSDYVKIIEGREGKMSMTTNGNVYENAVAERVNGILKSEFYLNRDFENLKQATKAVAEAIRTYNEYRPHNSIGKKTPLQKFSQYAKAA